MKYNRIRLEAYLDNQQLAVTDIALKDGCNIILTDSNTQGKSSIINALVLGLGLDDLVKSNVSALINQSIKIGQSEQKIDKAYIYLQIENEAGDHLSLKRQIRPRLTSGIEAIRAPLTDWTTQNVEEYYLGINSYNGTKGFHRTLSNFIGFPEIPVISYNDDITRLYLEQIFSAIFIEQKQGWGGILSTTPPYQIKESRKNTIAEILGLDYIEQHTEKNRLKLEVNTLKIKYETLHETTCNYIHSQNFLIERLPYDLKSQIWDPKIYINDEEQKIIYFNGLLKQKKKLLETKQQIPKNISDSQNNQFANIIKRLTSLLNNKKEIDSSIILLEGSIRNYQKQMNSLEKELTKNNEEKRLKDIFSQEKPGRWVDESHCPTCTQEINGTLLLQDKNFSIMSLEENIQYIKNHKSLLNSTISVEKEQLNNKKIESKKLEIEITNLTTQHSSLQKSLSGMIPSEYMEKALEISRLEQEIQNLENLESYVNITFKQLKTVYDNYHIVSNKLKNFRSGLCDTDIKLLDKFQEALRKNLNHLGYTSHSTDSISIDRNTFLPHTHSNNTRPKKTESGSSASDGVRMIIAYTLALHTCRINSKKSKHPNISIFDEPAQQNMEPKDYLNFYSLISDIGKSGGQIIIAATDTNHEVHTKALELKMNVIDFEKDYVLRCV